MRFSEFIMQAGGLHFGGIESALIAVQRHLELNNACKFYLYTVLLDVTSAVDVNDQGCSELWDEEHYYSSSNVLRYTNVFEPSSSKSYAVFDCNLLNIESVQQKNIKDFDLDQLFEGTHHGC